MGQKEKVVRYMAQTRPIGSWFYTYEVAGKFVNNQNTGIDPDTRLYSIVNDDGGVFSSENYHYHIEHRRIRKFAEFRIARRIPVLKSNNAQVLPTKANNSRSTTKQRLGMWECVAQQN